MMIARELTTDEYGTIERALGVLEQVLREPQAALGSPKRVAEYLTLQMALHEREVFCVLLLDSQNRLIEAVELFHGTLTQTAVYPREVAKLALQRNAAAVILAHNHPSGVPTPSAADEALTTALARALALLDIAVLDHVIVAGTRTYSFAENGMMR